MLAGRQGQAEWLDPSTGKVVMARSLGRVSGVMRLDVPAAANASGAADWLLVVRAEDDR